MKKTYKQETPILGIPVLGYKDKILPEVELYRWTIIENMLIAGTQGVRECVFDDGYYRLVKTSDDTYDVIVGATGGQPDAAHGMVSGTYFKTASELRWKDLKNNNKYWLYLRGTTATIVNPAAVRAVISRHRLAETDNCLLMASVNLREGEPVVNPFPDGKVYSKDIARHVSDKENPHGRRLYQDELVITDNLVLRNQNGDSPTIEVEVDGEVVKLPANMLPGAIAELAGRAVEIIDFESFGPEGGVIEVPNRSKVINVTVTRRVVGSFKGDAGEIAVGYFGEDEKADVANEFVVYNSGEEGLPMKAMVFCR